MPKLKLHTGVSRDAQTGRFVAVLMCCDPALDAQIRVASFPTADEAQRFLLGFIDSVRSDAMSDNVTHPVGHA